MPLPSRGCFFWLVVIIAILNNDTRCYYYPHETIGLVNVLQETLPYENPRNRIRTSVFPITLSDQITLRNLFMPDRFDEALKIISVFARADLHRQLRPEGEESGPAVSAVRVAS